jgi:DNA modification methylase
MAHRILTGDCRETLKTLPDRSVQCVVTSPPYFGLRDYQVDGQIGLESSPEEYVANLVGVFREVWRVLRDDGVLWLNLGDSYANDTKWGGSTGGKHVKTLHGGTSIGRGKRHTGIKAKELVGIPWMTAFAIRADGWYLRQDIVQSKSNPMPDPVTDRCTRSHEYLFMFTKRPRYFYDADAIREDFADERMGAAGGQSKSYGRNHPEKVWSRPTEAPKGSGRNKHSVWNVNPRPFEGAHFAVMPPLLVEPCILAGTSAVGCCPTCGAPWERTTEREKIPDRPNRVQGRTGDTIDQAHGVDHRGGSRHSLVVITVGWEPSCKCPPHTPVPCTVLDPFGGSGTVGMVANWHNRDSILCELNPDYIGIIEERVRMDRSDNGGWKEPRNRDEASLDLLGEL